MPIPSVLPVRPKPKEFESLTSWLCRVALYNGIHLQSFCHLLWPGRQALCRDLDLCSEERIYAQLAELTGTDLSRAFQTTIKYYQNRAYDVFFPNGRQKMVLRFGTYHRTHRNYGQQWCPLCLKEQDSYLIHWRFAFVSSCVKHRCKLYDRCPECLSPACIQRGKWHQCEQCKLDRRQLPFISANTGALSLESDLLSSIETSNSLIKGFKDSTELCLTVRQLMRILASGDRAEAMRNCIAKRSSSLITSEDVGVFHKEIEALSISHRHCLISLTAKLLEEWPKNLIETAQDAKMWKSWILRDWEYPEFMLTKVAKTNLSC